MSIEMNAAPNLILEAQLFGKPPALPISIRALQETHLLEIHDTNTAVTYEDEPNEIILEAQLLAKPPKLPIDVDAMVRSHLAKPHKRRLEKPLTSEPNISKRDHRIPHIPAALLKTPGRLVQAALHMH